MKNSFQKVKLSRKQSASSSTSTKQDNSQKLNELKAKIQQQRLMMKKSGKRFGPTYQTSSSVAMQTEKPVVENKLFAKKQTRTVEVSIGETQQLAKVEPIVKKQTIQLHELDFATETTSLASSRVFEREVKLQKKRNKELDSFLRTLGLQQFTEGLINMGYDDIEVLLEIKSEQLNFLRMRGQQQDKLISALKQYRKDNQLEELEADKRLQTHQAFIRTKTTMNSQALQSKEQTNQPVLSQSAMLFRPKSAFTEVSTNNSGLHCRQFTSNPSFFCGIGGGEWSLQTMVRRACSSCFRVFPSTQLSQEDSCYYCQKCLSEEMLGVSLNESMVRDYKL